MKLIRRKKKPTPLEQALGYAKLGVRGLVAARLARNAFKTYKFARKLPFIVGAAAIAALVLKKKRGGGGDTSEAQWTPPSTAQTPSSPSTPPVAASNGAPPSSSSTPPKAESDTPPPAVETAATGSSPADVEPPAPTAPATEVAPAEAEVLEAGASTDTGTTDADGPELKPEGGDLAPELGPDDK